MCYYNTWITLLGLALIAVSSAPPTHAAVKQQFLNENGGDPQPLRAGTLEIDHPLDNDIFRAGDVVEIHGTVQGDDFEYYVVEWGFGEAPSEWFTTGIELMNDGELPVDDGTLALWDTTTIDEATFTTVRVTAVFGGSPDEERMKVYLDPTLREGWPVKLYADDDIGHFEPTIVDLNGDHQEEIIVYMAGDPPTLHMFAPDGQPAANFPIEVEPNSGKDGTVPYPAIGDMNNDGDKEIVVFRPKNWNGNCADPPCVLIYNYNGELLNTFPVSYEGFTYPNYCRDFATGKQELMLGDLDGNGTLEIVIHGEQAATVLDNTGQTLEGWPMHLWGWVAGSHEGTPSVGNFDADDDLEIVIANDWAEVPNEPGDDRGRVYVFNADGATVPGWPVTTRGYSFSSPTVGDVDGDGQEDVIVGFMYWYSEPTECAVHIYDRTGAFLDGWPQLMGREVWSNPILGDCDEDGAIDIVVSDTDSHTYMFAADGTLMNGWPQTTCWVDWYSPVIGDITGDGLPDVITTNNLNSGVCSVYAWTHDGALIDGFPKVTGAVVDAPAALADLDHDGTVELIATSRSRQVSGGPWLDQGCIYVWDMNQPYDATTMHWPMFQHDLQRTGRYVIPPDCNENWVPDDEDISNGTSEDCNNNGVPDECDIADGTSGDENGNGIPDECECPADFDGDGDVDTADLLYLLGAWGTPDGDVDFDGDTDTADLLALLAAWGSCE